MADPEDPRLLAAQFELVQRELSRVERRLGALQDALAETRQAASTLRSLAEATGLQETLVPVGAGIHVRATLDPAIAVVRPIGAGYATDATVADALAELESRAEAVQRSFQEASADADRLANTAAALNERLQSVYPESS